MGKNITSINSRFPLNRWHGKIQFHAIPGRIAKENLLGAGLIDKAFAELNSPFHQSTLHRNVVGTGKRHVIECCGDMCGPDLAWRSLTEVQNIAIASVKPITKTSKGRPSAFLQPHHLTVKIPEFVQQVTRSTQVVMIESDSRQGFSPWRNSTKVYAQA